MQSNCCFHSKKMVPRGGIEPPTRGFSIHCSTPELPGHRRPPQWSGERFLGGCSRGVQWIFPVRQSFFVFALMWHSKGGHPIVAHAFAAIVLVCLRSRHGIASIQPFRQIDVGATARAERPVLHRCFRLADRTAHLRSSEIGKRERFRCNS